MRVLEKLFPFDELKQTIVRFPLSVMSTLALFVLFIMDTHDVIDLDHGYVLRAVVVLWAWYFWFGITKLMHESMSLSSLKTFVLTVTGALGIVALTFSGAMWAIHFFFLVPVLLLALMFAAFFKSNDDLSFWFFNRKMWFGVLVSYFALLLFGCGVMAALGAIKILFSVDIPDEFFSDVWVFAALVLGPIYALSWVPKSFSFSEEDCHDPPGLKFIVNWISVPMVFVYLLILYAYFIKIIVTGEVPNGHLAIMISGFVGAGIVTYLAAFPLREEGSKQLRLFYKIFFPSLIIPVGFHFYAILERVSAYGITEQRYMLLLSAIWFAFLAFGYLFKKLPIKVIPMVLSGLMLIACIGPFSALNISGKSQFSRLEGLLIQNNLLVDGKAIRNENAGIQVSYEDRKNISSILQYMCRTERDEMIMGWFQDTDTKDLDCSGYSLTEEFGFDFVSDYQEDQTAESNHIYLSGVGTDRNYSINVEGYKRVVVNKYMYVKRDEQQVLYTWKGDPEISAHYENDMLVLRIDGQGEVQFDLKAYGQQQIMNDPSRADRFMQLEAKQGRVKVLINIASLGMKKREDAEGFDVNSVSFSALVDF